MQVMIPVPKMMQLCREIANQLLEIESSLRSSVALADGLAGDYVFLDYLSKVDLHVVHPKQLVEIESLLMSAISSCPLNPSLYGGLTGVLWSLKHVARLNKRLEDINHLLADIDQSLLDHVRSCAWHEDFDLISGIVGYGVYALEAEKNPLSIEIASECVRALDRQKLTTRDGYTYWYSMFEKSKAQSTEDEYLRPQINLGVAHGLPGVVNFLSRCCVAGILPDISTQLLKSTLPILLSEAVAERPSYYSYVTNAPTVTRLGWCYGDLSVAPALLASSLALGDESFARLGHDILLHAARRRLEDAGVVDSPICHGASSNAVIFLCAHHKFQHPAFAAAAQFWYEECLKFTDEKFAESSVYARGFKSFNPVKNTVQLNTGLLVGVAGIGLALLAAQSETVPEWGRVLQLDAFAYS